MREELDYEREAKLARLYARMLADRPLVRVPKVFAELSTRRLLTLQWLDGAPLIDFERAGAEARNAHRARLVRGVVAAVLALRRHSRRSASRQLFRRRGGRGRGAEVEAVNLFDYGCVRIFPAELRRRRRRALSGAESADEARIVHAYEIWGFPDLSRATIAALNIWARFIYGPLIDDRVRTIADGVKPGDYGRREIFAVMQALKAEGGGLKVPREFVFLDRAAIGLGGAFLRLGAAMNFHRLFEEAIDGFDVGALGLRQAEALAEVGLA